MMQKIFIGILVVVTAFQLISNTQFENLADLRFERLTSSSAVFECPEPTAAVHFDLEDCSAILNNTDMDYSEFTPEYSDLVSCAEFNVVGGFLYRERPDINRHSCTPGVDSNTVAMCISALDQCNFVADSELAIRFEIEVNPINGQVADLGGLSFYEKSPLQFEWLNGPTGPNNYPTLFGIRVLKNGVEIFSQIDIPTQNDWNLQLFDFTDIPEFQITESAVFSFEILPYCLIGNSAEVAAWDIDEISILTCCGDDCSGYESADIDFSVEVDSCVGTDVYVTLTDQTGVISPDLVVSSWDWEIQNGNDILTFSGPVVNAVIQNESTVITLLVTLFNGCEIESQVDFIDGVLPQITSSGTIYTCNDLVYFTELYSEIDTSVNNFSVEEIIWNVSTSNFDSLINGANVFLELSSIDDLTAQVSYVLDNGCVINAPAITDFAVENLELEIDANVTLCQEAVFDVTFSNTYNFGGAVDAVSYSWTVTLNGVTTTSTGETVTVTFNEDDELFVESEVVVTNGCILTDDLLFDQDTYLPLVEIFGTALSCEGSEILVEFDLEEINLPPGFVIDEIDWTATVNNVSIQQNQAPFTLLLNIDDEVVINAGVTFTNGCHIEDFLLFDGADFLPEIDFSYTVSDCEPANDIFTVEFQIENLSGNGMSQIDWELIINGITSSFSGESFSIDIAAGSSVSVIIDVDFNNGCTANLSETLSCFDPSPEVAFDISVIECINENETELSISALPSCVSEINEIVSYLWSYENMGNTVTSTDAVLTGVFDQGMTEVSLTVEFESGCVVTISELVSGNTDIEVSIDGTAFSCEGGDQLVQFVANIQDTLGLEIDSVVWVVETVEGTINFTGNNIVFETADVNQVEANAVIYTVQNCTYQVSSTDITILDAPSHEIEFEYIACNASGFEIEFSNNTNFPSVSQEWLIDQNGVTSSFTTPEVTLVVNSNDEIEVVSTVVFIGGCTSVDTLVLNPEDVIPTPEIIVFPSSCDDEDLVFTIDLDQTNLPAGFQVESSEWDVTINGTTQSFSNTPFDIAVNETDDIVLSAVINYTNGCQVTISESFNASDIMIEVGFTYTVADCNPTDGVYNTTFTANSSIAGLGFSNVDWNFNIDGNITNLDGESVTIDIPNGAHVVLTLDVIYDNGCTDQLIDTIEFFDPSPELGIGIIIQACAGDSIDLQLFPEISNPEDYQVSAYSWQILNGGLLFGFDQEVLDLTLFNGPTDITLEIVFENGCVSTVSEMFIDGLLPELNLKGTAAKCGEDDFFVQYIACLDDSLGLEFTTVDWVVTTLEGTINLQGDTINFQTANIQGLDVSASAMTTAGCNLSGSADVDPVVLIPDLNIGSNIGDCSGAFFDVELFNLLSFNNGLDPVSFNWNVIIDGISTSYDTDTIIIQSTGNDTIMVTSEVILEGGCILTESTTLITSEMLPMSNINIELLGCPDDFSILVNITDDEELPPSFVIDSETWTISFNGVDLTFDSDPLGITLPVNEEVTITHEIFFTNGCSITATELLNTDDLIPDATFAVEGLNCDAIVDSMLDIIIYNTTVLDTASVDEVEWFIIINGQSTFFNTDTVMITVPIGTTITVSQMVEFSNGCTAAGINTITIDIPSIEFLGDPIFACGPDDVFLVANPNPDWIYTWMPEDDLVFVGGDTSNPIANVDSNTVFVVTVDNGICEITDSVEVIVMEMDSIILAQMDDDCDGSITLSVVDPIPGAEYMWSLTEDFTVILDTGVSIEVPNGIETYYVTFNNIDDCTSGVASITTIEMALNFTAQNPMVFCEGDTLIYSIINNDPNQTLSVTWESDPHILSDLNSDQIMVTIFDGETSFDLTAVVENNFGCDSTIVITFMAGEIGELGFMYTLDCETLEVCFLQTTGFNGDVIWDFGDLNTDADTSLLEAPCYMYPMIGDYTITLNSNLPACNAEPVQMLISVIDMIDVEIGADTNVIFETKELELFVFDGLPGYEYVWSTGETTPTITVSPEVGIHTFSVTVTDQNGCTGVDEFVLDVKPILCNEEGIYIPNAFSPNGDGQNDVFMVRSNCLMSIDFTVYNRWGEPIFHTTDPNEGWNGTYKSRPVQPDAFAYCLIAVCATGETYETRGNVSLLR